MNEQEQFWSGNFGDEYTKRNRVDWRARIPFWHDIMKFTGARSVLELGCNAGWNLSAIADVSKASLVGCEINKEAIQLAQAAGLQIFEGGIDAAWFTKYELVFTSGVLIHVATENLEPLMRQIIAASTHYILAIEYAADAEEMIEYRGEKDRLWKRNYGALYEVMGLKILHEGEAVGFDRCQYWLMEKP